MNLRWTRTDGSVTTGPKDAMMQAYFEANGDGRLEPCDPPPAPPVIPSSYFKEVPTMPANLANAGIVCGNNCGSEDFGHDPHTQLDYCRNCGTISGYPWGEGAPRGEVRAAPPAPARAPAQVPTPTSGEPPMWEGSFSRLDDGSYGIKLWMPDQPDFDADPSEGDLVRVTKRNGSSTRLTLGKFVRSNRRAVIFEKGARV